MGLDQNMFVELVRRKPIQELEVPEELEFIKTFCMGDPDGEFFSERNALQVGYWRNDYELNEFMQWYWDGGEFNCQRLYLEEDILDVWEKQDFCTEYDKEVIEMCRKVLAKGLRVYYWCWW